jgi:hypothetical protein
MIHKNESPTFQSQQNLRMPPVAFMRTASNQKEDSSPHDDHSKLSSTSSANALMQSSIF